MIASSKSVIEGLRLPLASLLLVLCGCGSVPPPQAGGSATASLGGFRQPAAGPVTAAVIAQGENPAGESQQTVERQETRQEAAPVASVKITETPTPAGIVRVTEQFAAPAVLTSTIVEKTSTALGAAQKDTGREIAASLAGMRPVQYAGIGFLFLALACFHPVVRTVIGGGKIVPALAGVAGLVLVFGPQLFAGRETLALVGAAVGILGAFLVVRLSHKEGQLDAARVLATQPGPHEKPAKKSRH